MESDEGPFCNRNSLMGVSKTYWSRYSLRTLLALMVGAALFFGGYRLGYRHAEVDQFDELLELVEETIDPDVWDEVGGAGTIASYRVVTRCYADVDEDGEADVLFVPVANKTTD